MIETMLAFLVAGAGALVPVITVEVYLLAAAAVHGEGALVAMALAAGAGQALGKLAYYYVGMGALRVGWLRRRAEPSGKWRARMAVWQERARRRPWWIAGTVLVSALASVPPFMLVSVLAGAVGMRLPSFLVLSFAGRTVRFLAVVLAPGAAANILT